MALCFDFDLMKARHPFCNLTGPANILVMPGLHAANISFKLHQLGNVSVVGPMMIGGEQAFQIVQMGASVSDIVQTAVLAAHDAISQLMAEIQSIILPAGLLAIRILLKALLDLFLVSRQYAISPRQRQGWQGDRPAKD